MNTPLVIPKDSPPLDVVYQELRRVGREMSEAEKEYYQLRDRYNELCKQYDEMQLNLSKGKS